MWSSELMAAKDELAELGVSAVAIGKQQTMLQFRPGNTGGRSPIHRCPRLY